LGVRDRKKRVRVRVRVRVREARVREARVRARKPRGWHGEARERLGGLGLGAHLSGETSGGEAGGD